MGITQGKPFTNWFQAKETRIVVFGLPGTGKSSIVYKLKTGEKPCINIATIGFDLHNVKYKESNLTIFDMGGQDRYKALPLWRHYCTRVSGFVYVVDSTDEERIEEAKEYLNMVIDEIQDHVPENVAVLVYGNKHEVVGSMSASEISNKLDLASLRLKNWQRNWHVQSSCALSGDGLHQGFDWLLKNTNEISYSNQ